LSAPLSTERFFELQPDQLITIAPGRGPFNRDPFLAKVEQAIATNPAVIYARTTKTMRQVRLVPVYSGARCERFRLTGSAGEWQVTLGYDRDFLTPTDGGK